MTSESMVGRLPLSISRSALRLLGRVRGELATVRSTASLDVQTQSKGDLRREKGHIAFQKNNYTITVGKPFTRARPERI